MDYNSYEPVQLLKKYVNAASGSYDKADVDAFADLVQADFESLGMKVERNDHPEFGPTLVARYGQGTKQIMLMGHMDTVFPHDECQPFRIEGEKAYGSGVSDMKGGIVVMYSALKKLLPELDTNQFSIAAVLNPDEEIGSSTSYKIIEEEAAKSIAALSFEPRHPGGGLVCERKGVIAFSMRCTGIRGHAGAAYKTSVSAIQELANKIVALYTLRDDDQEISINIGSIEGGTGDNIVAGEAMARGEIRYYDQALQSVLMQKMQQICDEPGLEGSTTTLKFGASHPALKGTPQSFALAEKAKAIGKELGQELKLERSGGASDIAFAGQSGTPVLDGLGLLGSSAHTVDEYACLDQFPFGIELAYRLMKTLIDE